MAAFDNYLFFALYNLSGQSDILDGLIVFIGEYYLFVILVVFGYFMWQAYLAKGWRALFPYAVALLAGVIARYGVSDLIRIVYNIPRPFVELSLTQNLLSVATYSFPSGHTIFISAVAAATYFFNKKLSYVLFSSAFVVGVARIAGGVHYPSDVIGGLVLGSITGAFMYIAWLRYVIGPHNKQKV